MSLRKEKMRGNKNFIENLKKLKKRFELKPPRDLRVLNAIKRHIIEYENPKTPSRQRAKIRWIYHPLFMKLAGKEHKTAEINKTALQAQNYLH